MNAPTAGWKSKLLLITIFLITLMMVQTPAFAKRKTTGWGDALHLRLILRPTLLDYGLPEHPRETGMGHAGIISSASLVWFYNDALAVEAGALARLPFSHNFEEELGAFPILAILVKPFDFDLVLRFGSLDPKHGYHPALLDEARYRYGGNLERNYNRSLVRQAQRDLGDPFLPVENGIQLRAKTKLIKIEGFLDWQLLETKNHREKFAVGVLGMFTSIYADAGFQLRLVHYGGQIFTKTDPIRRAGLDNKRQTLSLALLLTPRLINYSYFKIELPLAFINGRTIQDPSANKEENHRGFELGADVALWKETLRVGYRFWLPNGNDALWVSEDGDPIYSQHRSHRASVTLKTKYKIAEIKGRLDVIFAYGAEKVQYLTVTELLLHWEPLLWSD